MLIANPLYDTVFKYLMQNIDIAKGLISRIIDEEIDHLDFNAQETAYKGEKSLTIYRLDFIARIRQKGGAYKNVLIELQKSNLPYDIMRFRKYLGEQYKKKDELVADDGTIEKAPLPIITIYFLGFYLSRTLPGVIKINRHYIDVLAGKEIKERNDFIERLSHDSFIIQIPALQTQMRNRLERVLSIFKQENFILADFRLKNYSYETDDQLVQKMVKQLANAAADKEMLREMELEEMAESEYENIFGDMERKLLKQEKTIEEKDKALDEKERLIKQLQAQLKNEK